MRVVPKPYLYCNKRKRRGAERIDQGRSPRGGPRGRRAGSGGARPSFSGVSPKAGTGRPRAPVGRAPERRRPSRPPRRAKARKRRASGVVPYMDRGETLGARCDYVYGPGRNASSGAPSRRESPPSPSALPRWSCRHPVCGRVSRPRRGGGAYNTELVAAEGKAPERRGAPRPAGRPAKTF